MKSIVASPLLTVSENVFDEEPPPVTVTVKLVAAMAAAGVPVIWPVDELKIRPAGRLGVIANP